MIPMRWPAAILFALMLWPAAAMAVEPGEMLSDPALEARARDLSRQLRCMVCQNESIDDSNAPLAHDIRVLVRQRLLAGDSDRQVLDFLVARYGEFVLLKPRFSRHTLALWFAGPAVLIGGAVVLFLAWRRRRDALLAAPAALSKEEEERLDRILSDGS